MNEKHACKKYLLRCVSTEAQLAEYVKWYITSHVKNSETKNSGDNSATEDAIQDFIAFFSVARMIDSSLSDMVKVRTDNGIDDYVRKVMEDESVPGHKTCHAYRTAPITLSDADGETGAEKTVQMSKVDCADCCRCCAFGGDGQNKNLKAELAVLKFISKRRDNLDAFIEVGGDADFFKSVFDVGDDAGFTEPLVFHIYRRIYEYISTRADSFYNVPNRLLKPNTIYNVMDEASVMIKSRKGADNDLYNKIYIGAYRSVINMIDDAEDLDVMDVQLKVAERVAYEQKLKKRKDKKAAKKASGAGISKIDDTLTVRDEVPVMPAAESTPTINEPDKAQEAPQDDVLTASVYQDDVAVAEKDVDTPENIAPAADPVDGDMPASAEETADEICYSPTSDVEEKTVSDIPSDNSVDNKDGTPPVSTTNDTIIDEKIDVDEGRSEDDPTCDTPFSEPEKDVDPPTNQDETSAPDDEEEDIIEQENIASDEEITAFSYEENTPLSPLPTGEYVPEDIVYLAVLSPKTLKKLVPFEKCKERVFTYAADSHTLPIEIVCTEDGTYYYLMWIPKGGYFTYVKASEMPVEMVLLLKRKSIVKVCWQPYYLYAVSRLNGVNVTTVHSIYSADLALNPCAQPSAYENLVRFYATINRGSLVEMKEVDDEMRALYNAMPYYAEVFDVQQRDPRFTKEFQTGVYEPLSHFDAVLGFSYMMGLNFETHKKAFAIRPSGEMHFVPFEEMTVKRPGYLMTFAINAEDIPDHNAYDLFKEALIFLEKTGRFRKINIQLLYMDNNVLHLFVANKYHDFMTNTLQIFFNKWAVKNNVERFALITNHKAVIGKDQSHMILPSGKIVNNTLSKKMSVLIEKRRYIESDSNRVKGLLELRKKAKNSKEKVVPFGKM